MTEPKEISPPPGPQGQVFDATKKMSHLHEWKPAPNPKGNRAERRAAKKKRRTP